METSRRIRILGLTLMGTCAVIGSAPGQDCLDYGAYLTWSGMAGRRGAMLADRVFGTGPHALTWDGRDAAGAPSPSGAYLVRVETAAGTVTRKSVLAR